MGRRTPVHVEIHIRNQEQVETMIKKFSRNVKKSGILEEVKERRYFTKKSQIRRLKRLEKKRLAQKAAEKQKKKFENEYN
jgi:ribosomal protein S21